MKKRGCNLHNTKKTRVFEHQWSHQRKKHQGWSPRSAAHDQ